MNTKNERTDFCWDFFLKDVNKTTSSDEFSENLSKIEDKLQNTAHLCNKELDNLLKTLARWSIEIKYGEINEPLQQRISALATYAVNQFNARKPDDFLSSLRKELVILTGFVYHLGIMGRTLKLPSVSLTPINTIARLLENNIQLNSQSITQYLSGLGLLASYDKLEDKLLEVSVIPFLLNTLVNLPWNDKDLTKTLFGLSKLAQGNYLNQLQLNRWTFKFLIAKLEALPKHKKHERELGVCHQFIDTLAYQGHFNIEAVYTLFTETTERSPKNWGLFGNPPVFAKMITNTDSISLNKTAPF